MEITTIFILVFSASFSDFGCQAIDICLLLGNCNNNNNKNYDKFTGRSDDAVKIDPDWIEAEGSSNNQVYHFATSASSMDWFEADAYCVQKGGFLAEPLTSAENDFLKGQASKIADTNWWLGLREAEDCSCRSEDARATLQFDASIDYSTMTSRANNGFVKTKCPSVGSYSKVCRDTVWRWSYTGGKLTNFNNWNQNEPNGHPEYCSAMWFKAAYRWSDWLCSQKTDSGRSFKPICQKDKGEIDDDDDDTNLDLTDDNDDDYDEDYDEDYNEDFTEDTVKCVDDGVVYRAKPRQRISKVFNVDSAEDCRRMCADNPECNYWTWVANKNKKCSLKRALKRRNFRKTKPRAVSGTMLNGCRPIIKEQVTPSTTIESFRSYCVEYGAMYKGGDELRKENGVSSAEECRGRCVAVPDCRFYSFLKKRRRNRCVLYDEDTFEVVSKRQGISGSIEGNCKDANLDDMTDCNCVTLSNTDDEEDDDRLSLVDILNGGAIDGRISNSEIRQRNNCPRRQVNRCSKKTSAGQQSAKFSQGDYCVDYDINYDGGNPIGQGRRLQNAEECRLACVRDASCEYYTFHGDRKTCSLKRTGLWTPALEPGSVSGTTDGQCRDQPIESTGFCECVELEPDYYDDEFVDLVGTGAFQERSTVCPVDQGKRCYARIPDPEPDTSSRIFFGRNQS